MPSLRPSSLAVRLAGILLAALLPATAPRGSDARADDKVIIGTDWRAEAEHGGIYQAFATGIYKRHGLDVEIRQGGPNLNQAQLLAAGRYDFSVQSNSFEPLNFVRSGVPIVAVAAAFQKDPQVLIAHPGAGHDTIQAMKGQPILISAAARQGFWQFLVQRYGFTDSQLRPYTFNLQPFLADRQAIMQGYLTSEPYAIELATGEKPVTILLADQGYDSYAALIATTRKTIQTRPDLVRRMVAATMEGWSSYIGGDPGPANDLIKKDNPEMTDAILSHARDQMIASAMVTGGDAAAHGVGAMSSQRWHQFFGFAMAAGIYPGSLDWQQAFSLDFVGHPAP